MNEDDRKGYRTTQIKMSITKVWIHMRETHLLYVTQTISNVIF